MSYYLTKAREVTWTEWKEEFSALFDLLAGWLFGATINHAAEESFRAQNYVAFVDRRGIERARLADINGFYMLECLVKRGLGVPLDPEVVQHLAQFGNGTLCGWWKRDTLASGKSYFKGRRPVKIVHDVDDTAWWLKLRGVPATDAHLLPFLSQDSLPSGFYEAARACGADPRFILRTWEKREWHKWDCDLLCMANMISALPRGDEAASTELQARVFQENARLINAAVASDYEALMMYYEPKVVGAFLLLFYDREHRPFLTDRSREVLGRAVERDLARLDREELGSRWAGDDRNTYIHGYNLQWRNAVLPLLFATYTRRHLLSAGSSERLLAPPGHARDEHEVRRIAS
ncbi:hypothetical protein [Pendulispora albinea]|uniref:Uncharacterized protein n=1 Tax=Pendulispora albinea TaxID=2741071 RepID=A0ABZ2MAE4_9BACT